MLFTLIQIFLFLLSIKFYQELITWSERFHAGARVTAFSQTSLFLERFGANLNIFLNSSNHSEKPTDLKMILFTF